MVNSLDVINAAFEVSLNSHLRGLRFGTDEHTDAVKEEEKSLHHFLKILKEFEKSLLNKESKNHEQST